MKRSIIALFVLLGLVLYAGYDYLQKSSDLAAMTAVPNEAEAETGIGKGQLAPNFMLTDLEGNEVELSDFKGKKVLLNFWATWCPPCRIEMPHMRKFYEDYRKKDVVILGVNLTPTEKRREDVSAFVQEEQLSFPIVLDETGEVMLTYQVFAYPTTFLLDSNGIIRERFQGAISYDIMKEAMKNIK